jgi:hypothetical protein
MKVLFISDPFWVDSEIYNAEGYANAPMLKAMPCELEIATTLQQARAKIKDVDVVLLEGLRAVSFWQELTFINNYDVFVGAFYCDVWRAPFWCDSQVRLDVNISVYREVALKVHKAWNDDNFLWLPPRVDLFSDNETRPVDIVTWGATGREYPFRNYLYHALAGALVGGPRRDVKPIKLGAGVTENKIKIAKKERIWHHITGKRLQGPLWGASLMDELSQAKLCPTGPVIQVKIGSVVARFFENAAAGLVSITPDMEDAAALGFVHGENIWFSNAEDFFRDIDHLLGARSGQRIEMSQNAVDLIFRRHSVEVRAMELYDYLKEKAGE